MTSVWQHVKLLDVSCLVALEEVKKPNKQTILKSKYIKESGGLLLLLLFMISGGLNTEVNIPNPTVVNLKAFQIMSYLLVIHSHRLWKTRYPVSINIVCIE